MGKYIQKKNIGYWRRGKSQYWNIMKEKALMINTAQDNKHYDGDAHIFFKPYDISVNMTEGMEKISKEEFEKVRDWHTERLKQF